MATQYFCSSERRRELVRAHATLNGIDYLEVLDDPNWTAGDGTIQYRQRLLVVTLLKAVPNTIGAGHVHIVGGSRVPEINVLWALKSTDPVLLTQFPAFPTEYIGANNLVVFTDSVGDYSNYTLSITKSNIDLGPHDNFDPQLSSVEFSTKVECPSDFDCKPVQSCPVEPLDEPLLDYLTKDYNSFRQLMLDRLAVTLPDWKERNASDVGVALVEVLAYAADYLSYYQDAVSTEAYIGTARKRVSMHRHARLLNYPMHDGSSARVWINLEISGSAGVPIPKGTPFLTRVNKFQGAVAIAYPTGGNQTVNREKVVLDAVNQGAEVYETLHAHTLYSMHNEISFYTWLDEQCCLPKGATRATLLDKADPNRLRLRVGDVLVFEEARSSETGQEADADPSRRHAVRLTRVYPEATVTSDGNGYEVRTPSASPVTDPVSGERVVEIEWSEDDALPFALCLSAVLNGASIPDMARVRGNVILADHGRTITDEPLLPGTVPEDGVYRPQLRRSNVTQSVPYDHNAALKEAATTTLNGDSSAALAAVTLKSGADVWVARRDLLGADRFSTDVVVETESDGISSIRFGDDVMGRMPSPTQQFTATYRVGNGHVGNVGPGAIAHIVSNLGSVIQTVTNLVSAAGGTDPEPIENVRLYAPQAFRVNKRAVTKQDYSEMAQRHPEVQSAQATIRWTGSWATAYLTVDRKGGRPVDDAFRQELLEFMEQFRLMGRDIEINGPSFISLEIIMEVCVESGYYASNVKAQLLNELSNRLLPDGRRGLFHPDNYTFNQPVYLSQVVSAAMAVPGVAYVKVDTFRRIDQNGVKSLDDGKIIMGRLEVARLDNDRNRRENGTIDIKMKGGL